jgi:hypothetical protein
MLTERLKGLKQLHHQTDQSILSARQTRSQLESSTRQVNISKSHKWDDFRERRKKVIKDYY